MSNEVFKEVPGHVGYRVGTAGTVQSCLEMHGRQGWLPIGPWKTLVGGIYDEDNTPRRRVCLRKRRVTVGRLVLEVFVGPCPTGMECCHNNGDSLDDRLDNVRWDTKAANISDREKHGTTAHGATSGMSKLLPGEAENIRQMYLSGIRIFEIHREFPDVSRSTITKVARATAWRRTNSTLLEPTEQSQALAKHKIGRGETHQTAKLTEANVLEIRRLSKVGITQAAVAKQFSICVANVGLIVRRQRWAHLPEQDQEAA